MSTKVYELSVQRHFSAAHSLRGYEGPCAQLHGHNYQVEVTVTAEKLDRLGMAVDFGELKRICDEVIDSLDHQMLNELEAFQVENATSERLAEYLFHEIVGRLPENSVKLRAVRVWETPTASVTYREG